MADKQIKFRAVLDTQGFDQQIKQMQDRVSQITRQSGVMQTAQNQYGSGSGMSKLTQSFFGDFNKGSISELRDQFNLNVRQMQHQQRDMREKERELVKLTKLEKEMTEAQKERVKLLKDEISTIKEKGRTLIEENNKLAGAAQRLGAGNLADAGFKGTGTAPEAPQGFFGRARGLASNVLSQMGGGSVLAGIAGVGIAGMRIAGDSIDYYRTRDRQLARNIGESVQSANIGFDSIMQRRGFMNQFENPERQAALQMAMSEEEKRRMLDPLRAGGSALTMAGGAWAGGKVGAGIGSLFGPLGTLAGGGIGALVGGAGGLALSGGSVFGERGIYQQLFDREAYNASVGQETLGNFRSNLTALKMANPEKFLGAELFGQKQGDLQGLQRQLNLSDTGTISGLQDYMKDSSGQFSFSEARIRNNIDQILQSGGSSDFITRQIGASLAGEYQRGGLTNAAAEMGGISAAGNMEGKTEEQYKKFIADAMRIGLDSSEFAKESTTANEEVRRAMGAISEVYSRTGGAEGAADLMAAGMMGGAGAQIQGAQTAFDIRNQESGQGTGYRGALKQAYLNSAKGQEAFSGLPEWMKQSFASYNIENLDEDDILIRQAAEMQGISPKEMLGKIRNLQMSGENYSAAADEARQAAQAGYQKYLKDNNLKDTSENRRAFSNQKGKGGGQELTAKAFGMAAWERGDEFSQMTTQSKESYVFGGFDIDKDLQTGAPDLAKKKRGGFDEGEGSGAKDDATALEIISRQLPDLSEAAKTNAAESMKIAINTKLASESLQSLLEYMKEGGEDKGGVLLEQLQKQLGGGNQPNMGNKKNK